MNRHEAIQLISKIFDKKYFVYSELCCKCGCESLYLDEKSLKMLLKTRVILDKPIIINSAYRCEKHNKKIGSTSDNHTGGYAFDIKCESNLYRLDLINSLLVAGFRRIIIYSNFIHADNNLKNKQGLFFRSWN